MNMKKVMGVSMAVGIILFSVPIVSNAFSYPGLTTVKVDGANFRVKPSTSATRLGIMYKGEKVYDFGMDFNEGDPEFDHIYRYNTNQSGYTDHHNLDV